MSNLPPARFWDFSVKRYALGENMHHCLALQDKFGVNINLLLLLGWCVSNNIMLTLVQWQALRHAIKQSDEKLNLHRQKRRKVKHKTPFNSVRYQQLKDEELSLERLQQADMLAQFNQQTHHSVEPQQVNGSIPAFIHLYNLRGNADALALIAAVVN
ncbi:TIGR02444 family protein [Alteromonas sp. ASW11-130]|uniref:TIGR02444 family protein n=1 Tax=Alteromonas sp. ASW11-130 TaxID=3015775 RepID=UPI002241D341|nr:TIGR02444 family protein [Alteromonas sp. ASW11-130]MCW8093293.1 TIGR02444 family protein [Alteromonas sp. ASW11-130]